MKTLQNLNYQLYHFKTKTVKILIKDERRVKPKGKMKFAWLPCIAVDDFGLKYIIWLMPYTSITEIETVREEGNGNIKVIRKEVEKRI